MYLLWAMKIDVGYKNRRLRLQLLGIIVIGFFFFFLIIGCWLICDGMMSAAGIIFVNKNHAHHYKFIKIHKKARSNKRQREVASVFEFKRGRDKNIKVMH